MPAAGELAERARLVAAASGGDVPSPCVSVCKIDAASGLCQGCCRTLDEIAAWSGLSNAGKRKVWRLIGHRAAIVRQAVEDQ